MRDFVGKRYWLVGASEGLGRALAFKLVEAGAQVIVSARSVDRLKALCAELGASATHVTIDVANTADVKKAYEQIGPLDGCVYLAGVYWPMAAQEADAERLAAMCDINFTGAARVVASVLPDMTARDDGHMVITGSLSGFRGLPGAVGYGASKAGTMYLAESLYADLRTSGVDVQLINPGFIKTRLTEKNDFNMPFIMEADEAADIMFNHMKTSAFKRSFPTMFSFMFRGSQFLPDWLYYRIFGKK